MTKAQLAGELGASISAIATLERNEARGTITIQSLRRLARGLDCTLVYALLPKGSRTLDELIRDRAESKLGDACDGRLREHLLENLGGGGRRDLWR